MNLEGFVCISRHKFISYSCSHLHTTRWCISIESARSDVGVYCPIRVQNANILKVVGLVSNGVSIWFCFNNSLEICFGCLF